MKKYRSFLNYSTFLFPFVFFYYELLLKLLTNSTVDFTLVYAGMIGIAVGCLINSIIYLIPKKKQHIAYDLILVLAPVFYVVEVLTKRTFQVYMTISVLLADAKQVATNYSGDLINSIIGGFGVILLYFLPLILYIAYRIFIWRKMNNKDITRIKKKRLAIIANLVLAIVLVFSGNLMMKYGKYKNTYTTQFEFNQAIDRFGLITGLGLQTTKGNSSTFVTVKEDVIEDTTEDTTEETTVNIPVEYNQLDLNMSETTEQAYLDLNSYVSSLSATNKNNYTGIFKGKNLILICAEAFSDAVIDPNLTPTLYRLTHNGFYFSDYYQPTWGGSTSTGEFSFLLGLVPMNGTESILYTIGHNNYFTLPNQLQRSNYYTAAYHANTYTYYDRDKTHVNLGFNKWIAQDNGIEDITGAWPNDVETLTLTLDSYVDKQPFCTYYMTLSGHCPYNRDNDWRVQTYLSKIKEYYGDKYPTVVNNYLCYQMQLEDGLTALIAKLEEYGIADNTVIALTADHYPYGLDISTTFGNTQNYVFNLYGEQYDTPWGKDHNTLIIWSESLENDLKDYACEVSTPTYSLDIVPTLSNLFGLDYDSRLLVGRDVFSDASPLVIWNDYSWKTDLGSYNSNTGVFTPVEGAAIPDGYLDYINATVTNKISYSKQALYTDYFGYLFGPDTVTDTSSLFES